MQLPRKKPGDWITAAHVNILSEAAERSHASFYGGKDHQRLYEGGSNSDAMLVRRAEVTDSTEYLEIEGGTPDKELNTIQLLYYDSLETDSEADKWKKDAGLPPRILPANWPMDPIGTEYSDGDRIIVYYDVQRGAWVPISADGGGKWIEGIVIDNQCPENTLDIKVKGASDPGVSSLDQVIRATDWFEIMDGYTAEELQSMGCRALAGYTWRYDTEVWEWRLWLLTGVDECDNIN